MKIKDHVVVKQETGSGFKFECLHCGSNFSLIVPVNVSEFVKIGDVFAEKHNGCRLPVAGGNAAEHSIKVLDHGYVKRVASMGNEEMIIRAARQSTDGSFVSWEPYENHPKGDAGLLAYLYKHQHMTPFEMCELVVEVQVPIFIAREWMRHRTFSYNEASARYAQMPDMHYIPGAHRMVKQATKNKQAAGPERLSEGLADACLHAIKSGQREAYVDYEVMLQRGLAREVARINAPVSRYTKFWCKGNLRNWLHFLGLRLHEDAQWEIREYAKAVAHIVQQQWPRTWALFEEHTLYAERLSRSEALRYKQWKESHHD